MDLNALSLSVEEGEVDEVKRLVKIAIDENMDPAVILNDGMVKAMTIIGDKFRNGEAFAVEMMVAARAMSAGLEVLEPVLISGNVEKIGKAVIGTISGDLHDIGKNLVGTMLKGAGFEVFDLGVDVPFSKFVDTAEEVGADIICMSALLTTTMIGMKNVVDLLVQREIRDKYKVMVGGAPITQEFCDKIGADVYTQDAASAAEIARKIIA